MTSDNKEEPWLLKKLAEAERIQKISTFCANYKGTDKEVLAFCSEWEEQLLKSIARVGGNG